MEHDWRELAAKIDHTNLKPEATPEDIIRLCQEAKTYGFAAVCVNPVYVPLVQEELDGSAVRICTVVGFPLGANGKVAKCAEAEWVLAEGAQEVDMVIHVGGLKSGDWKAVQEEVQAVTELCHKKGALCKVILEMALLTDEEKRRGCELCVEAGADFVKTSTGFGPGGATVEDVRLMASIVRPHGLGVKAAGGIRSYADALSMLAAGATRIGASAGVRIIQEARGQKGKDGA
jgi:deoxyribose-phosphate aldolase